MSSDLVLFFFFPLLKFVVFDLGLNLLIDFLFLSSDLIFLQTFHFVVRRDKNISFSREQKRLSSDQLAGKYAAKKTAQEPPSTEGV